MSSNPFINTQYIIYESTISTDCTKSPSTILLASQPKPSADFKPSNPMNLLFVENYLSDEIAKFIKNLRTAKTCDNYASNMDEWINMPSKCGNTFKNFAELSQSIPSQFTNDLSSFSYTDSYIATQPTTNDAKPLCQRLNDLQNMIKEYSKIINTINPGEYTNQLQDIQKKYKDNIQMRAILQQKLSDIYSGEKYANSKRYLDSTIYTSVLWTILATTILFYVFKKM